MSDNAFWGLARPILEYSVDTTEELPVYWQDQLVHKLNPDRFFGELYVPQRNGQFEAELLSRMQQVAPLTLVVGSRGSGKSSGLLYTIRSLTESQSRHRPIYLNIKKIVDQEPPEGVQTGTRDYFRAIIRQELLDRLFEQDSHKRLFLAWALAGAPDSTDVFDRLVTSDLLPHSTVAISRISGGIDLKRRDRTQKLLSWFDGHLAAFEATFDTVWPKLRPAHVMQAAVSIGLAGRLVIVYDNVDRLNGQEQRVFFRTVRDSQETIANAATQFVAIRPENLKGVEPEPGAGGSFLAFVETGEGLPAVLVPDASDSHMRAVMERRHKYCVAVHADVHKSEPDPSVPAFHKVVLSQLSEESITELSNGSLRSIISIYSAFTNFLNSLPVLSVIPTADRENHLHTLLYLWIREKGHHFGVPLYDFHKRPIDEEDGTFAESASENHLLLTCLLNLHPPVQFGHDRSRWPTYNILLDRMRELGFTAGQVRNALADIATGPGDAPSAIEFLDNELKVDSLPDDSAERLRLTRMGIELVRRVYSKVGYIWGLAYDQRRHGRGQVDGYLKMEPSERPRMIHEYAFKRAKKHLRLMELLGRDWKPRFGPSWLDRYRVHFGVQREVQLERILTQAAAFYGHRYLEGRNPFEILNEAYKAALIRIQLDGVTPKRSIEEMERTRGYFEKRRL